MNITYKLLPRNYILPVRRPLQFGSIKVREIGVAMYSNRGALIVLEGADRSGKSTQCEMLVESLKQRDIQAEAMRFPDRTTAIGQLISQYLSNGNCKLHDKAIHMLFSANRWECYEKILSKLRSGVTLIIDRYSFSGITYSASKLGMDIEWCKTQEIGLPKPDLVCLLTVSEEELSKRPGFGNERYENKAMQRKVLEIYKQLADTTWEVVDASGSIESVHGVLLQKILDARKNVGKEIESLEFKKVHLKENVNFLNSN